MSKKVSQKLRIGNCNKVETLQELLIDSTSWICDYRFSFRNFLLDACSVKSDMIDWLAISFYRITSVIRPWPCIRYKAIWRFEKSIRV